MSPGVIPARMRCQAQRWAVSVTSLAACINAISVAVFTMRQARTTGLADAIRAFRP